MLCLGIESSCDETALAVVRDGVLLDAVLASQADIHALFGGVVPELASREHYRYLGTLFDQLMQRLDLRPSDLDVVAVSRGPGLLGTLLVAASQNYNLLQSIGFGFGSGVGYLAAVLVVDEGRRRLRSKDIPHIFRGLPSVLIYIGILSLAIYGLVGTVD